MKVKTYDSGKVVANSIELVCRCAKIGHGIWLKLPVGTVVIVVFNGIVY